MNKPFQIVLSIACFIAIPALMWAIIDMTRNSGPTVLNIPILLVSVIIVGLYYKFTIQVRRDFDRAQEENRKNTKKRIYKRTGYKD